MELIGQGGIWKIYKIEDQSNVFRIPKGFGENSINQFIKNHELIKILGLPTLERVEKYKIDGKIGIICDNVNCSENDIYVTYNSLCSDSQKMLFLLSKDIFENKKGRESSLAEDFRYKNKLEEITNLEQFLTNIVPDLKIATQNDILIEFDSYFFGTKKKSFSSKINYKIVDLDHIFTINNKSQIELYELNLSEFLRALKGFLRCFVSEAKQNEYLEYVKKIQRQEFY